MYMRFPDCFPHKMRGDISRELDTLIEDMLEERCQDRPAEGKGSSALFWQSWEARPKWRTITAPIRISALIGPPLLGAYKAMMRIVFWAVAGGMLIAGESPWCWITGR